MDTCSPTCEDKDGPHTVCVEVLCDFLLCQWLWAVCFQWPTFDVCFCHQAGRVVVSRSFADFTPQATFDIKVGWN